MVGTLSQSCHVSGLRTLNWDLLSVTYQRQARDARVLFWKLPFPGGLVGQFQCPASLKDSLDVYSSIVL